MLKDWTKIGAKGKLLGAVAVNGSPCDCVLVALSGGLERWTGDFTPDLLVSGVNLGANIGTDINHSGTVGAAREGALHGIPSLATSLTSRAEHALHDAVEVTISVIRRLLAILPVQPGNYLRPNLKHIPWQDDQENTDDLKRAITAFGCADLWFNLNIPPSSTAHNVNSSVPGLNIYRNAVRKIDSESYIIGATEIEKPHIEGTDATIVERGHSSLSVMPLWPSGHPLYVDQDLIKAARYPGEDGWPAILTNTFAEN